MSTTERGTGLEATGTTVGRAETLVPHNHLMAGLLGQRDELLRLIEGAFPQTAIAVQGAIRVRP